MRAQPPLLFCELPGQLSESASHSLSYATTGTDSYVPDPHSFTWTDRSLDFALWQPWLFSLLQFEDHLWLGNLITCSWVKTEDWFVCAMDKEASYKSVVVLDPHERWRKRKWATWGNYATKWPTPSSAKERPFTWRAGSETHKAGPKKMNKLWPWTPTPCSQPPKLQSQSSTTIVTEKGKDPPIGKTLGRGPYQEKPGCGSSPASHPCTSASEQGPRGAILPGWSPQPHPWMSLIPVGSHSCSRNIHPHKQFSWQYREHTVESIRNDDHTFNILRGQCSVTWNCLHTYIKKSNIQARKSWGAVCPAILRFCCISLQSQAFLYNQEAPGSCTSFCYKIQIWWEVKSGSGSPPSSPSPILI